MTAPPAHQPKQLKHHGKISRLLTGLPSSLMLMHICLSHRKTLSNTLAHWRQGLYYSHSQHSHESWMIAWTLKIVSMPIPLHSLRSALESSHDQMLKVLYFCGLNTWSQRVSKPMGKCWRRSGPDSRNCSMFQTRRGFWEMDGLHRFVEHTRFVNSTTMGKLDQSILPLSKQSKCGCTAFCQNLPHRIGGTSMRQISFLCEFCRFNQRRADHGLLI